MEIFVIGSERTDRLEGFQQFVRDRGCNVHLLLPGRPFPCMGGATEGVVFFDDGGASLPEWVNQVRDCTRYLSVPLIAVAAGDQREAQSRLQCTGASVICEPNVSDHQILQQLRAARDARPVIAEVQQKLLQPFKAATMITLREMARTDASVRLEYQKTQYKMFGDISAVLGIMSVTEGSLVLSFPDQTARAVVKRVLEDVTDQIDEDMVRDCVGELANVIAGQAKGMLAGTRYQFTFSTPTIVAGVGHEIRHKPGMDCLVIAFTSDLGDFALQLCLNL